MKRKHYCCKICGFMTPSQTDMLEHLQQSKKNERVSDENCNIKIIKIRYIE